MTMAARLAYRLRPTSSSSLTFATQYCISNTASKVYETKWQVHWRKSNDLLGNIKIPRLGTRFESKLRRICIWSSMGHPPGYHPTLSYHGLLFWPCWEILAWPVRNCWGNFSCSSVTDSNTSSSYPATTSSIEPAKRRNDTPLKPSRWSIVFSAI